MRSTWTEIVRAFQIMSGFELDDDLDLSSQEKVIKTMFRKIANVSKTTASGQRISPSTAWTFGPSTSLKVIIGQLRLGILRRPILTNDVSCQILPTCMDAQGLAKHHTDFGVGFKVRISSDRGTRWLPSSFARWGLTQQQVAQVRRKALGQS